VDPKDEGRILPWQGKLDYDRILWIDSDTVFAPEDIERLLAHSEDIVTGMVKVDLCNFGVQVVNKTPYGGTAFATIRDTAKHPDTGEMVDTLALWVAENKQANGLCPVDLCGSAFLSIKRGVYEAMEYPWYRTEMAVIDGVSIEMSEDIGWCRRATAAGFKIWADPEVRPGHEKALILK
jgi:GT2 family glycosyltransferase